MARLPDIEALGGRPIPQSRRSIATVRNAGAVGDAAGNLGATISQMGQQMLEREDKLTYAAAKSAILRADVNARIELQDDPDFETYESRYQEKMAKAREMASGLIKSKMDRRLFEVDTQLDMDRGAGEVRALARTKRVAARGALLVDGLETLRSTARDAPDDETRTAIFSTAKDAIDSAAGDGTIDPVKAVELRRGFVSELSEERVNVAIDDGDIEKAERALDTYGRFLTSDSYTRLHRVVDKMRDDNVVMAAADVGFGEGPVEEVGPITSTGSSKPLPPVPGAMKISSGLGDARPGGRSHNGLDIPQPVGTPVRASGMGRIVKVWNDTKNGGGLSMVVDYGGGVTMGYAHLSEQGLNEGDVVRPGQTFAKTGNTGKSSGPHLHWTARVNGKIVDPRTIKLGGQTAQAGKPTTLGSAIERAVKALGPNPEPAQVAAVRQEVEQRWRIAESDERDRDEGILEAIQGELVKNGGNWRALPQSVKNKLPAKYWDDMLRFADAVKEPEAPRKTDPAEYVRLTEMAVTKPREFARLNPVTYFKSFDQPDWERLVAMRNEVLGKEQPKPQSVSVQEIRAATKPALEAAGITTVGLKDDDRREAAERQYKFERAMLGDVAVWQAANPGKKPSATELQAIADRRLLKVTLEDDTIWGPKVGKEVFQFEAAGRGQIKIPGSDYSRIVRTMAPILGRNPTQTEVYQAYIREARGGL